jgi:hypothetical protein
MARNTWIVTHGSQPLIPGPPENLFRRTRPPLRYARPFLDALALGPQHVDLPTQALLRHCYHLFRIDDEAAVEEHLQLLNASERLAFWCNQDLSACLAILWALDALATLDADLRNAVLVFRPSPRWADLLSPEEIWPRIGEGIAVPDVLPDLVALRRHLASDSDILLADLDGLPEPIRSWCTVTDRLADFLPDDRGLDLFDSLLLDGLTDEWQRAVDPITSACVGQPQEHTSGETFFWRRLLELSDKAVLLRWDQPEEPLCEVAIDGPAAIRFARTRITRRGRGVRSGRTDALKHRGFFRWVGGRLLTNERVIRRAGNYRKGTIATDLPRGRFAG